MDRGIEIRAAIRELVKEYFRGTKRQAGFVRNKTRIPLMVPSYDWEEVCEAIDSLLTTEVTMGKKVRQFEAMFADYVGVKYAVMVNSGSSANLMALSILTNPTTERRILPGDEVITPALTWATTVFPIVNCGAVPVLVDVSLDTLNIDPDEVEMAITPRTRAIMLVHLLGNPCDMGRLMEIAQKHNLFLIEDACEAHGAEYQGRRVGSIGDLATFSFFFAHHISTIEGGMLLTNNEEYAELAKALRVFGWIRDLRDRDLIAKQHEDMDPRFIFINTGYNFRPTELQGAFGIWQMGRLEKFIETRRDNARFWTDNLGKYADHLLLPSEREGTRHVWYGYPICVKPGAPFARRELTRFLEEKAVETRPIMAGNIDEQPAMKLLPHRTVGNLERSKLVNRNAFFFGNHHGIGAEEREALIYYFQEFVSKSIGGR